MNTTEAKVGTEDIIKGEISKLFRQEKFREGTIFLQGLSFRLKNYDNTEIKSLVLRNLSFAFYKIGDINMAKKYANMIKDIADKDLIYQEKYMEEYYDILNLYSMLYNDEISLKDKLRVNKLNRRLYCNDMDYMDRYYVAEFNIYLLTNDFDEIESLWENIHNMDKQIIFKDKEKDICMKEKLNNVRKKILNDLEIANPLVYRRISTGA